MIVAETCACTLCKAECEPMDCASTHRGGKITSCYGSVHDTSVFKVMRDALPDGARYCDNCVSRMIDDGRILELPETTL